MQSPYSPDFEVVWKCWVEMEGFINPNDGAGMSIFGVNTHFNPEMLVEYRKAQAAPKVMQRPVLESIARTILKRKYWERSLKEAKPTIHFFFKNAWSVPASRAMSLDMVEACVKNREYTGRAWSTERIGPKGIERRLQIYERHIGYTEM